MTSLPESEDLMLAAVSRSPGQPPALVEIPRPAPGPGEVQIRIRAASVNPTDVATWLRGAFVTGQQMPFVGGYDMSGVITAVGRGVSTLKAGDQVTGMPRFPHPAGAFAEYATAPVRHLAKLPEQTTRSLESGPATARDRAWAEVAAIPLAGLTAWQALVDTAQVHAGDRVLIHAASGGVGHLAVQLAAHLGTEVTAVTSERGRELVQTLGANHVVLRESPSWYEHLPPQDVVLDTVGEHATSLSLDLAGTDGLVISLHPYAHDDLQRQHPNRLIRLLVEPDHHALVRLLELYAAGRLSPHVASTYDLIDTGTALAHVHANRTPGKTTIRITPQGATR